MNAAAEAVATTSSEVGRQLYIRHCSACHGERGDGKGVAAAFLFPKPRDFRAGRFRLVTTRNNVPTRDDLHSVLLRGMPGSAMPPWAHLSQADRDALVTEVLELLRDGARERYVNVLREDEGLTEEEMTDRDVQREIEEYANRFSTPGATSQVAEIKAPTAESITRGRDVYAKYGCIQCHGKEGKGDGVETMFDDEKLPTSPRDFTRGIFKGGDDPVSLYRRVAYGMPGTPMPGSTLMTHEQMVDLVHYIRSLSTDEQRQATILKRAKIVAKAVDELPGEMAAGVWSGVEPVHLGMVPLWWRNDANPDLTVQALHDGTTVALRLSWRDESEDGHAASSDSFEDAVAVELFGGDAEPSLGMGDMKSPIDLWFWDADRQGRPLTVEELYPNTIVDRYPFSEKAVSTAELDREGARTAQQPAISLPAVASGNPIVPTGGASGASTLTAGGPGSVTFRMPQSQLVTARGQWKEGRWEVVMRRAMAVESDDDGACLEPGERVSIAFAVWDGSHQDRNGKKSITIWHDLVLEEQ